MRPSCLRILVAVAASTLLGLLPARARADFLSDLIGPPQHSLSATSEPPAPSYSVIGSNWSYSATGQAPPSSGVTVIADADFTGLPGFEFQGAFHDNPGGEASDGLIQYRLSLSPADIAAGRFFTDVHLESDLTIVNGSTANTGSVSIVETVRDQDGNLLGTLTNFDIWTASGQSFDKDATLFLDPSRHYTVLNISKDILMSSDSGSAVPQVSHIDQTYSVPEPSSMALIVAGLSSCLIGVHSRRRILREMDRAARDA